jgi:hypothetical protein
VGAGGGPGGEGESEGEVVVFRRRLIGEAGEFFEDVAAGGEGAGDAEEAGFEQDSETREEVAAGDELAAVGVGGGVVAGGDRDGNNGGVQGEAAEELDEGGADAGGVDGKGLAGVGRVAGEDGPRGGMGRRDETRQAAEEFKIGQAKGEAVGEAEAEDEAGFGLEGDGVCAAGGEGEAFEEDEGGGVMAAAEVESEEKMGLGEGGGGFAEEHF